MAKRVRIKKRDGLMAKKRKTSDKESSSEGSVEGGLLEDLISYEILPRLPIKLLFRFKLVCKRWNSLITHNNNLLAHRHHSRNNVQQNPTTSFYYGDF